MTISTLTLNAFAATPAIAQIETLLMPGEVIEAHAEIETECGNCHAAFARDQQKSLCLDCHEDIAQDQSEQMGFHGLTDDIRLANCASCHTDHEGRKADIAQFDSSSFEHDFTDFPLFGNHEQLGCNNCHAPESKFRDTPSDCNSCHEPDDAHLGSMGIECGDCHESTTWDSATFDHGSTGFELIGEHIVVDCLHCHEDQTFAAAPTACISCHADDDSHNGRSGEQCQNCHNPIGWDDTSFDHQRDTRFSLDGSHSELACNDCHSDDPFRDQLQRGCASCHAEDDSHDGHFGPRCDTCHVASTWDRVSFDHDIDTNHPLLGAHEKIGCVDCHVEPIFEVKLEGQCVDCHVSDDPHEGTQGIQCSDCHDDATWTDNLFFDHDLTNFPLLGEHANADCNFCHESHRFVDATKECVDCHKQDNPHEDRFSFACANCHNPVGWEQWIFDHNTQSDFILDGAHVAVACNDCHRQPLSRQMNLGATCADCHRSDDIHDGEFGLDCGRCHSSSSFKELRRIQ